MITHLTPEVHAHPEPWLAVVATVVLSVATLAPVARLIVRKWYR